MIKLSVAVISAVLEPSTAASATAALARFLGNTALGTHVLDTAHKCFCVNVEVNNMTDIVSIPAVI